MAWFTTDEAPSLRATVYDSIYAKECMGVDVTEF
jgi:hypothetical protein